MLIVSLVLIGLSAENVVSLYGGCVTVSIFVHYFTLVAVMWMGAEALLMFQKLVIIFTRITTKFIISVSIVCWSKLMYTIELKIQKSNSLHTRIFLLFFPIAVPIVFVLIPFIVDLANGSDFEDDIITFRGNEATEEVSL